MHIVTAMRHLTLLLLLLPFSALLAAGQEPVASINPQGIVDSFEISGVPEGDISPTLRGTMQKLVGAKFDQQATEAGISSARSPNYSSVPKLPSASWRTE